MTSCENSLSCAFDGSLAFSVKGAPLPDGEEIISVLSSCPETGVFFTVAETDSFDFFFTGKSDLFLTVNAFESSSFYFLTSAAAPLPPVRRTFSPRLRRQKALFTSLTPARPRVLRL